MYPTHVPHPCAPPMYPTHVPPTCPAHALTAPPPPRSTPEPETEADSQQYCREIAAVDWSMRALITCAPGGVCGASASLSTRWRFSHDRRAQQEEARPVASVQRLLSRAHLTPSCTGGASMSTPPPRTAVLLKGAPSLPLLPPGLVLLRVYVETQCSRT